jgi:adenylate cyclase
MALGPMTYFYRRLGWRYPSVFLTVELHSALFIVAGTLGLFTFYYDGSTGEFLAVLAVALVLTEAAVLWTLARSRRHVAPMIAWLRGERDADATAKAWAASVGMPVTLLRRDLPVPVGLSVLGICIAAIPILDLSWLSFFPLLLGSLVSVGYAAVLHYLAVEAGMRPVLLDINSQISPRTSTELSAVRLRWRLLIALPLINLVTGLVVAALTSGGGGSSSLGADVLIALAVATTISFELTLLLSKSILRPIHDLERAVDAINAGDYTASVPVTTGDELGELAASFNEMVEGLRERERIREAFGTYLDREVAEYILSDGFEEQGVDVEVTVLFCDVRDFTAFAADASPEKVVASLNGLFEVIVPIIAGHGGHVDKFEGDGLLAVFGAPEPFLDHADRAVHAACEIDGAVNERGEAGELRVGVGVNSGTVVAGAIGGAGRLNFSVIGGAVNLAARVEAATRELGDPILITVDTWKRLGAEFEAESRGKVELKGIEEPVALYSPRVRGTAVAQAGPAPAPAAAAAATGRRRLPRPRLRR